MAPDIPAQKFRVKTRLSLIILAERPQDSLKTNLAIISQDNQRAERMDQGIR
jgi:hypothetical protein